ncbi:MAG: class I SAM-dependent methyltransferase [Candidatus Omnitrophota bacterium]
MVNRIYLRSRILKPIKSWKNKYLKYLTNQDAKKSDLFNKTVMEISEYLKEPQEVVREKYEKCGPDSEAQFDVFKDQDNLRDLDVKEFYKRCSYYIYELPLWNAQHNRPKYLYLMSKSFITRNNYKKVLDFGAGTGDLCIELAKNNLDVTYCDIGEQLYNFANWRFKKKNLPVKMVEGIENLDKQIFDCIFSFDAFEHIKDLQGVIKVLVNHIRPGGGLIFSGAFTGGTLHLEENNKYDNFKEMDKLLSNCGLIFQDKFAQYYFYAKGRQASQ